jgi:MFS family permease
VVYATDKFHASSSVAGLSAGIFIIGAVLGRLYAGSSIERVGHKKMLYLSFAFYLVTTLLYFAVNSLGFLIAIRLIHGAAFGLTSTATGTTAAEIIPNERRGEGTGYYALSMTLAAAIGPFLGMFLIQHANFNANLIVCVITLSVSFLAAFPLTVPKVKLTNKEFGKTKVFALSNFFEAKALPISIVTALACFGYSSILTFLSAYRENFIFTNPLK